MKGDTKAIEYLNRILGNELIAINQYFLHSKMHQDWGFTKLHQKLYEESIDEMKHADILTDRILLLNGLPNLQKLGKLRIGQTPKETFECDLKLEDDAIADLKEAIIYMEKIADFGSRDLLQEILKAEEQHYDWIETQMSLIQHLGLENYLKTQV